jgi:SAM-dependent methyltransferase
MSSLRTLLTLMGALFAALVFSSMLGSSPDNREELADFVDDSSVNAPRAPDVECTPTLSTAQLKEGNTKLHIHVAFDKIYASEGWGKEGRGSGDGSSLNFTQGIRAYLAKLVKNKKLKTFVDVPCGSANWIPPLLAEIRQKNPCFEYRGMDVVKSVIAGNKERFKNDLLSSFDVADVSSAPLPNNPDLILSRDALQHLPINDGINVLENIAKASPRYFVVGSYKGAQNVNVPAAGYYDFDIVAPPFDFPEPIEVAKECCDATGKHPQKYLYLYTRSQLAKIDFDRMKRDASDKMVNGRYGSNLPGGTIIALDAAEAAAKNIKDGKVTY